jgi:hypothetical protein
MPDETDYARLRRDVGADAQTLDDSAAAAIFAEAEDLYDGPGSILAGTRVIALQGFLAEAADEVNYTQNNASENLSDRFKNLEKLLDIWQKRLDAALAQEAVATDGIQPPASHSVRLRPRW